MNNLEQAIINFIKFIEAGYETVVGGASSIDTYFTDNGVFLTYVGNNQVNTYTAKVDSTNERMFTDFNVKVDDSKLPFGYGDND